MSNVPPISSKPTIIPLTATLRCALKARAHHLTPAVFIGQQGLTENVLKAIQNTLSQNDLIKIRVLNADRDERIVLIDLIMEHTHAELIQHIGRQIIFYRPLPKKKTVEKAKTPQRKSVTQHKIPSTRPKPKASYTHKHRTSRSPGKG